MKKRTKNLKRILINFNKSNKYKIDEAISILKDNHFAKFNSSINIYINLKNNNKNLTFKNTYFLPYSNGRKNKILVLIEKRFRNIIKDKINIEYIGGSKYISNIDNNDIINFDYIISSKYYMKYLLNFAKILGKKNILPNYDSDTIVNEKNYLDIIKKYKNGKNITIKIDKNNIIHLMIGKINFKNDIIIKNYLYIIEKINKINRNIYINNIYINTTMSPSLKLFI
ncbi:MAG: hypothetical protein NHF92_00020 [Candidatus Shikimatogenerans bostrichidophilus]|nr:MAG: hypothetical protein NHF92_00020 [Candidatus Shikimatogenerans bostrichidophilus]